MGKRYDGAGWESSMTARDRGGVAWWQHACQPAYQPASPHPCIACSCFPSPLLKPPCPHLACLVPAGGQHPVSIPIPLRLHDGALVAVQGAQVAPGLGAPQLDQAILAACSWDMGQKSGSGET
jgi:hypothetical protein